MKLADSKINSNAPIFSILAKSRNAKILCHFNCKNMLITRWGINMLKAFISMGVLSARILFSLTAPEFKANRISEPPVIDGHLNDPCWEQATKIDENFRNWDYDSPDYGKNAPVKTVVLIGYDSENLYVGFICQEPDMNKLRAHAKNQTQLPLAMQKDDMVNIYLNTFVKRTEAHHIYVNPNGVISASYDIERNPGNLYQDICKIPVYAATRVLDTAWTVEVRIPFQSLRFPSIYVDYWRIDFGRRSPARDFVTFYHWSPRKKGCSVYAYFALMHVNDRIRGPKKIEVLPYGLSGLTADTVTMDFSVRSGLGAKYYFDYNNILDIAFLPDFSQIESNALQIDVNTTTALYYSEQRPFFLERKGFFETPLEIFYTRLINDPIGAVKYTGSIKGYALGFISALDQHTPFIVPFAERSISLSSEKKSLCNILRMKKFFSGSDHLGILTTHREQSMSGFNRVIGIDGAFTFWGKNSIQYQGLMSWTREPFDTLLFSGYEIEFGDYTARFDGERFVGDAFLLEASRNDKHLSLSGYCEGISPTFRADNGYISYNDYTKFGLSAEFPYGIKKYSLEAVTPGIIYEQTHRYFNERSGIKRIGLLNLQFKYLISTQLSFQSSDKVYNDIWFKNMWSCNMSVSIATIRNLSFWLSVNYGRAINYYSTPLSLGYTLYPYFRSDLRLGLLSVGFKYYHYLLWVQKYGERVFDQQLFEFNLSYAFSRFMNMRVVAQHSSSSKNLLIAPLLAFTPTSLTFFYLGANHNFSNESPFEFSEYNYTRTQVFLKIQYLFRY